MSWLQAAADVASVIPGLGGLANQFGAQDANSQAANSAFGAMQNSNDQAALNRQFQQSSINQQEQFQAGQVAQQEAYQTQMSNTAYQRQVADMKAAGINPVTAAAGGGASTPSGAAAMGGSASGAQGSGSGSSFQNAYSKGIADSLFDTAKSVQGLRQGEAQIGLTKAQTEKTLTDTDVSRGDLLKSHFLQDMDDLYGNVTDKLKGWWSSSAKQQPMIYGTRPSVSGSGDSVPITIDPDQATQNPLNKL